MTRTNSLQIQYVEEQYETLTSLGKEGGQTFLAKEKRNGRIVVKKYVTADAALLYEKLRGIKSCHLAEIYELVSNGEKGIIIEEYISGITLRAYMEERGVLATEETMCIVGELCAVLDIVHKQGIIHRDLTPDNIILSGDGVVKLIDFGIAREVKAEQKRDTVILGTVGYAAPEQFGFLQSDVRADIYALGVLMNEMLTGDHTGQRQYAMAPFANIIKRCTEFDPEKRFQSVADLEKMLGNADSNVNESVIKRKGSCVKWLPGFRTGILWKNIVASLGYGMMLLSTYIYMEQYTVSVETFFLEFFALFLYIWMAAMVIVNVADWDRKLPFLRKLPWMLRMVIRVILGMVLFERGVAIENYVKSLATGLPMP